MGKASQTGIPIPAISAVGTGIGSWCHAGAHPRCCPIARCACPRTGRRAADTVNAEVRVALDVKEASGAVGRVAVAPGPVAEKEAGAVAVIGTGRQASVGRAGVRRASGLRRRLACSCSVTDLVTQSGRVVRAARCGGTAHRGAAIHATAATAIAKSVRSTEKER